VREYLTDGGGETTTRKVGEKVPEVCGGKRMASAMLRKKGKSELGLLSTCPREKGGGKDRKKKIRKVSFSPAEGKNTQLRTLPLQERGKENAMPTSQTRRRETESPEGKGGKVQEKKKRGIRSAHPL